jgi:acetyl-CoA acyltransferase
LAACVVKGTLAKTPNLSPERIEDLILGCAFPEAEQGMNMARTVGLRAGLPESTAAMTVNRFCSSGLQAIAIAANSIAVGQAEVVLAGGAESMSMTPMPGNIPAPNPYLMDTNPSAHMTMGATAENVAERYSVSREDQDAFAYDSHIKAANAQAAGRFEDQIIPVEAVETIVDEKGFARVNKRIFDKDEGIRANITMESLQKLRPVFKAGGSVTPGNASQISDGAAVALLMREEKARELGLRPLAYVRSYAVVGVNPAYMGIGPIKAIPKALKCAGLSLSDIQLFELNEAFASQAIACIRELELKPSIVNINGGAIALGHPLGCTGALLTTKLLSEMERQGLRYGVVSMCIGGGMGAAAVFERIDG